MLQKCNVKTNYYLKSKFLCIIHGCKSNKCGTGERLSPLTENTPKPLLKVGNKRLIEHLLHGLHRSGTSIVVINTSYRAELFTQNTWERQSTRVKSQVFAQK